jgi:hypothetical protein
MLKTIKTPSLARLRLAGGGSSTSASPSRDITPAENRPWTLIGEAQAHLLAELERVYWAGVEQELEAVLVMLRVWQSPEFADISLEDESDGFIHGFDTFVDQVSDQSRAFAKQVAERKDALNFAVGADYRRVLGLKQCSSYFDALEQSTRNATLERESSQLKAALRQDCFAQIPESLLQRRTRMLLQAIGLLDIDKLIEYRPPLDELSFWKRPAVPQLRLKGYNRLGNPILAPQRCSVCSGIIKGCMYSKNGSGNHDGPLQHCICEECHRTKFFEDTEFCKVYKYCILDEIITPAVSRGLCTCDAILRYDQDGAGLALFPLKKGDKHIRATAPGMVECGLLRTADLVAEAKYDGIRTITSGKQRSKTKQENSPDPHVERIRKGRMQRPRTITQQSQQAPNRGAVTGTAVAVRETEADDDIPFFLRKYAEKYPFGNVHMALRFGPVVVENGVSQYVQIPNCICR